jgi:predicted DNA-binding mobile mystery protein A
MKRRHVYRGGRLSLDRRWSGVSAGEMERPVKGWVRAIRESLGMTTAQLAQRLQVKQPSVVALEQSEIKDSIELATLRRAAAALNCRLVYMLVPEKPLEQMVNERARDYALRQLAPVEATMMLEDQSVRPEDREAQIEAILEHTSPRRIWDEV